MYAWIASKIRRNPLERERRRRLSVHLSGRIADAEITDLAGTALFYSYTVGGVAYTASQDISALADRIAIAPERLIGPAAVKYSPKNPANSILVCEHWSGLRDSPAPRAPTP